MKIKLLSIVLFFIGISLYAETIIDFSPINTDQPWTAANSPYIVTVNLTITKLTIEPGVKVQFRNNYNFDVDGPFHADGFCSDSIYFQPEPGSSFGWKGIKEDGKAIKYSELEAIRLMTDYPDFRDQVQEIANDLETYKITEDEDTEKNSEKSSTGT